MIFFNYLIFEITKILYTNYLLIFLVQAYLLSYLRNLQTTVDENKLEQKKFYGGIQSKSPKKSFSDILRYSQNLEYSYQNPFLHSGILLSGDIIYSHE